MGHSDITIDHTILLYKIHHYGIRGHFFKMVRKFTVINGANSKYDTVRCGVPQGSILGPLLFLIYINDLPKSSELLHYILFADDTSVFLSGKDLSSRFVSMNVQLMKMETWMQANKLILTVEKKTNFMIFGTRQFNFNGLQLYYKDKAISHVSCTKFLGVIVDDKLSWNCHVNNLCNIIARNIGILRN